MDNDLRKLAADAIGRSSLQERSGGLAQLSGVDAIALHKLAGADLELLKIAESISPNDVVRMYESLGGSYTAPVKE